MPILSGVGNAGGWVGNQAQRAPQPQPMPQGAQGPPSFAPSPQFQPLPSGMAGPPTAAIPPIPQTIARPIPPTIARPDTTRSPAMEAAQSYVSGRYGPQFGALQNQGMGYLARNDVEAGNFANQRGSLFGNYNSSLARNSLARRGLDVSRGDLGTQRDRIGLDMADRNVDRDFISRVQGLASQGLSNELSGIDANLASDVRNRNSDFTARGAWFAPFRRIENQESTDAAARDRLDANLGYQERQAGWDRDLAGLSIGDQRSQLDYRDIGSAERRLDLEAEQLGIERADFDRVLQDGLNNLGYSEAITGMDLAAMLNSNVAEQEQMAAQILQEIWQYEAFFRNNPTAMQVYGNSVAGSTGRSAGGGIGAAINRGG